MAWQPIATAPKDKGPILACNMNTLVYSPLAVWWAAYSPNAKGKCCWRTSPFFGNKVEAITHWMPLPDPPEPSDG